MNLKAYFDDQGGVGVLSTANADGAVNAAIYARPHVFEEDHIAFIMADRLTRHNLKSNPKACYLFKEEGSYRGKRLYLTCTGEEENPELVETMRRSQRDYSDVQRFVVHFKVNQVLPLIGSRKDQD